MSGSDFFSNIDLNGVGRIVNSLDPQSAQDLTTKAYVDANIEGLAWKDSCRVASTVNVTLSAPGATIDRSRSGSGYRVENVTKTSPVAKRYGLKPTSEMSTPCPAIHTTDEMTIGENPWATTTTRGSASVSSLRPSTCV